VPATDDKRGVLAISVDMAGFYREHRAGADVLNGIAYDAAGKRLFVTGKLWPKVFEIGIVTKK